MEHGIIPTPAVIFSDPGDRLTYVTSLWAEESAQLIRILYEFDKK